MITTKLDVAICNWFFFFFHFLHGVININNFHFSFRIYNKQNNICLKKITFSCVVGLKSAKGHKVLHIVQAISFQAYGPNGLPSKVQFHLHPNIPIVIFLTFGPIGLPDGVQLMLLLRLPSIFILDQRKNDIKIKMEIRDQRISL